MDTMHSRSQPLTFAGTLLAVALFAGWFLVRMVLGSDPDVLRNVIGVLGSLWLLLGSVVALVSWAMLRRWKGRDCFMMALRHGAWAASFVVMLPGLRALDALSPLVLGALLLIILGAESLLLLREEEGSYGKRKRTDDEKPDPA